MIRIGIILGSTRPNRNGEQLRLVCGALQMADVGHPVALSLRTEFENFTVFKPGQQAAAALEALLDQVLARSAALALLHAASRPAA